MQTGTQNNFFKTQVLGHPAGLFVLFFTEMWERFSFYGMRVLLVNFLTMSIIGSNPGWGWSISSALALYGTYAGLLYITPIAGGMIADKLIGYRWAVVIGAFIMTLGHASMAIETQWSLYLGLGLLVIGTGFFKPNMTSIISEIYKDIPQKKDGAYTIFYMGVNAGAFFGMMMCGYLAERVGWSWGFGLAGIFMLLGCLQFWLAKPLFGKIGDVPEKSVENSDTKKALEQSYKEAKRNPFTIVDLILIAITSIVGLLFLFNDPLSKIGGIHLLPEKFLVDPQTLSGPVVIIFITIILFLYLIISRVVRYDKVVRNRMFAVIIFAFFVIFFWMSFEQGASTLVIFARDFTDRTLVGNSALIFNIINSLLTIIPLAIITWVLIKLFKQTHNKILSSNIVLASSFLIIWAIALGILYNDFSKKAYIVEYKAIETARLDAETHQPVLDENSNPIFDYVPVSAATPITEFTKIVNRQATVSTQEELASGSKINVHVESGNYIYLNSETEAKIKDSYSKNNVPAQIVQATVVKPESNSVEVTTSWFSILNSFFIISLASLFTKLWDSKYNPPAAVKYGMGLIIMSIGFAILAFGSNVIPKGAEPGFVRVSMIWLVFVYLFHTMGELCLSPVGLSYVSKLVPGRMIAFMFGIWYLAIAIGNKLAASVGGMVEEISENYSMSTFFLIFTILPFAAGIIVILLNPFLKKLMGGVK